MSCVAQNTKVVRISSDTDHTGYVCRFILMENHALVIIPFMKQSLLEWIYSIGDITSSAWIKKMILSSIKEKYRSMCTYCVSNCILPAG